VRTRDRDPLQWASTQSDIGMTKLLIGYRSRDEAVLESGRRAVQTAWDFHRAAGERQHDEFFIDRLNTFDMVLATLRKTGRPKP